MNFAEKLANVVNRHNELESLISEPGLSSDDLIKMNKELSTLAPVVEAINQYTAMEKNMKEAKEMMDDASLDKEMRDLAETEYFDLKEQLPKKENDIKILLLPKDDDDEKNAILEVRAGTGGDEAALFAGVLFEMYQHYAALQGWKFELMDASENEIGGYKEVTASISGKNVFSKLKFESGAHRVQRVPVTESQGRVHTSAATVAVLPVTEAVKKIAIRDEDIIIQVKHARGKGGQAVNKHSSAIRMYHEPTGLVVESDAERSQKQNIDICKEKLQTAIYQKQVEEAEAAEAANRSNQVGGAKRSEKFRTYNEPQHRVTQHEDGKSSFNYEKFMNGAELDEFHFSLNRFRKGESCIW